MATAQTNASARADLADNWICHDAQSTVRLDLQPNGRFVFARQSNGHMQASMGAYRVAEGVIELNPGSENGQRLKYVLANTNRLRITQSDGTVLTLSRSAAVATGNRFSVSVAGSSAGVSVEEGGADGHASGWPKAMGQTGEIPQQVRGSGWPTTNIATPGPQQTPAWTARTFTIRSSSSPTPGASAAKTQSAGHVGGLNAQDLAMANAAIAKNTMTIRLPGLGTSRDGPGPLTEADRIVLLALKFYQQRQALVPFSEIRKQVERVESRKRNRRVAGEFWAWYREAAEKEGKTALGGYEPAFGTYITMKTTAKRKAANRALGAQVESAAAWQRATASDRQFREHVAEWADAARAARRQYLSEWKVQALEAAAAQKEWELYLTHGAGHMDPDG